MNNACKTLEVKTASYALCILSFLFLSYDPFKYGYTHEIKCPIISICWIHFYYFILYFLKPNKNLCNIIYFYKHTINGQKAINVELPIKAQGPIRNAEYTVPYNNTKGPPNSRGPIAQASNNLWPSLLHMFTS